MYEQKKHNRWKRKQWITIVSLVKDKETEEKVQTIKGSHQTEKSKKKKRDLMLDGVSPVSESQQQDIEAERPYYLISMPSLITYCNLCRPQWWSVDQDRRSKRDTQVDK